MSYGGFVAEHIEPLDLGVTWEPNAPDAILLTADVGSSTLVMRAHSDDGDGRCVVLRWDGCRYSSMAPPNDEAISGHRLWDKGLRDVTWAGIVDDSELIAGLELQNRVHPAHSRALFAGLRHYVLPLKECVVEIVARDLKVHRIDGTLLQAAIRSCG